MSESFSFEIKPLSECKESDLTDFHAFVFGRVKVFHIDLTDSQERSWHWSKTTWWKAMWYPHIGAPSSTHAWGVYGGRDGYTGPRNAELSHFVPSPPRPPQTDKP